MGLHDRDYMAGRRLRAGAGRSLPVTRWLLILNIAFFVFCLNPFESYVTGNYEREIRAEAEQFGLPQWEERMRESLPAGMKPSGVLGSNVAGEIGYWGVGQARLTFEEGQWWRLLTPMFLHANLIHIFFNMFVLWSFGRTLEANLGGPRYLVFYLLCGLGGSICSELMGLLPRYRELWDAPGVGASGAIYGVLFGLAVVVPHMQVQTMYGGRLSMRAYALMMAAVGVLVVAGRGANFGGELAHLGGGLVGLALASAPGLLAWLPGPSSHVVGMRSRRNRQWRDSRSFRVSAAEVDRILDKASAEGMGSLSDEERALLERFRSQR